MPVVTGVTAARPGQWETALGRYEFRHLKPDLLWGYRRLAVSSKQEAFVASPEKALLDLIYLQPGGDSPAYLRELRLQNLDQLDLAELSRQGDLTSSPKLRRAADIVTGLAHAEAVEYEIL